MSNGAFNFKRDYPILMGYEDWASYRSSASSAWGRKVRIIEEGHPFVWIAIAVASLIFGWWQFFLPQWGEGRWTLPRPDEIKTVSGTLQPAIIDNRGHSLGSAYYLLTEDDDRIPFGCVPNSNFADSRGCFGKKNYSELVGAKVSLSYVEIRNYKRPRLKHILVGLDGAGIHVTVKDRLDQLRHERADQQADRWALSEVVPLGLLTICFGHPFVFAWFGVRARNRARRLWLLKSSGQDGPWNQVVQLDQVVGETIQRQRRVNFK